MSKAVKSDSYDSYKKWYLDMLRQYPLTTKSCTSFTLASLGSLIAEITKHGPLHVNIRSVLSYGTVGFVYVAPLMHFFYMWLEKNFPNKEKSPSLAFSLFRLAIDRLVVAPPYLLGYFYILSMLEGLGHSGATQKIKDTFRHILITNIKVWSIFQFVNINYVPQEYRVLLANMLAFFWSIYVALARS